MTNREIRAQSRRIWHENVWMILAASLLSVIPEVLHESWEIYVHWQEVPLPPVLTLGMQFFLFISMLMVLVGFPTFMLDIRRGAYLSLWTLILSRGYRAVLLEGLLDVLILSMAWGILNVIAMLTASLPILLIAALLLICLAAWLIMRTIMTFPCAILYPEKGAFQCLAASWKASKGNIKRILGNAIALNWPVILIRLLLILAPMLHQRLTGHTLSATAKDSWFLALSTLTNILFTGYITLGAYALYETLLTNQQKQQSLELP